MLVTLEGNHWRVCEKLYTRNGLRWIEKLQSHKGKQKEKHDE